MRKKRIILPTDFSKNAWNAIEYALAIFKDVPCEFFILNAYQVGASGLGTKMGMANDTRLFQLIKEESERELKRALDKIHGTSPNTNHSFQSISVADNLVNAIGRTVYNQGVDFIIMGTKGATGLKEVFMGSNAYTIIREIDFCPIIAVPDDYHSKGTIRTILLATGYEHLFESYELKPLLQIAELCDAKILIAHVADGELAQEQERSKNVIRNKLKSLRFDFVELEKDSTINNTIQKMVDDDHSIDMVAMINHERGFFERFTRESVIKKVAFNSRVPFLVIHLFE